ncbi:MAG: GDP-mannose 4,6-dehydratase [Lachnospiraceae bacterium]
MKTALITGITGQDGSYLAEFLLEKEYRVYGLLRRGSTNTCERIQHLLEDAPPSQQQLKLVYGDLSDSLNLVRLLTEIRPDEIYNLAAQSHVAVSFEEPEYTGNADGLGVLRILEAVRIAGLTETTRIYQASTSELYGKVEEIPQKETTPFHPRSPYAVAKLYGYWITRHYREAYGMYAVNGILFNHESERRGETFVTRKITLAVANILAGKQEKLYLGNLNAKRDWGYAKDYVECMWLILQHSTPEDFVIATGETRTVREFTEAAFAEAGIQLIWKGEGIEEKGIDQASGKVLVEVAEEFFRPAEVDLLLGDPSKAKKLLGWNPRKTSFQELVRLMVQADIKRVLGEEYQGECC